MTETKRDREKDTGDRFKQDVKDHVMTIIQDLGNYRHIKFAEPGTWCYGFHITTWPGYLCFSGDMGCFVFSRITDMFEFFRVDKNDYNRGINPGYWSEKVQAADRNGGYEKFSIDYAIEQIKDYVTDDDPDRLPEGLMEALEENVFNCETEQDFREDLDRFEHKGFRFYDSWEFDFNEYTHHFLWCCHALLWAIKLYDEEKDRVNKSTT